MSRVLDFDDHQRKLGANRYVYAVVSRRSRGLSIGINLNPDKACNFDCPYCQVDRTVPGGTRDVDLAVLEAELDHLLGLVATGTLWSIPPFDSTAPPLRVVRDIAFAGDGEPTACSLFADAVAVVGRMRERHGLDAVKAVVLTNATLLHRPAVRAGLERLDALGGRVWAKLDAGTEAYFHVVDGTTLPLRRVLDNLVEAGRERPLVIQAMFITLNGQGPSVAERDAWRDRLQEVRDAGARIDEVQVYTVRRRPARPEVGPLDRVELEDIAARARGLGLSTEVYV